MGACAPKSRAKFCGRCRYNSGTRTLLHTGTLPLPRRSPLFPPPFRLSPFSLYSCLSFRSPFPLPRCSRAILLPLSWTLQSLVCRSSLPLPLCHSTPFRLRRCLCCSPFQNFFSSISFAFFLPLDLYSHPAQHLLQLGYPTRVAPLVSLLRFSLFYCSPSFLDQSFLLLLLFFFFFFLVLFFYFLFLSFFSVFHSFTFLQPSPSIAKAPPPVTQSTSSTAASVLISDGWVGETGAGDYYDWLIGNESPPPPPPTSCIHHLYAKRRPLIPHMPHCRASFALFCGTASERENRWPRDRPNPPVTDVLRRNMRLIRVTIVIEHESTEYLPVFARNASHLRNLLHEGSYGYMERKGSLNKCLKKFYLMFYSCIYIYYYIFISLFLYDD